MNKELSREVLGTLQQVHDKMKKRMMIHPEYCAMVALEKSIDSISIILDPPAEAELPPAPEDEPEQELESAIAETIASKVAPAQPSQASRMAPAAFLPMQRMGQAVGMR